MKKHIHSTYDEHLHHRGFDEHPPLSGTFMIVSIIGFVVSVFFTLSGRFNVWFSFLGPDQGYAWGTAFMLAFLFMFIASVVSITPPSDIDYHKKKKSQEKNHTNTKL
ncbi:MAG: hypothetical protein QW594_03640 [Candidatus Woesearchaeota archaeon]